MKALHVVLASSTMALLAACTSPETLPQSSPPHEIAGPTYITTPTATLLPAPGRAFGHLVAASAGDEGAIAFTESETGSDGVVRIHMVLQRLDATGASLGDRVELGAAPSVRALALAAGGGQYLACWEHQEGSIACAGAPVGQGAAFPALSVDGAGPALAYGSGAFALAYGTPGEVAIVRVASDGTAVGSATSFDAGEGTPKALLAATQSGFVLVGAGDSDALAHRLDSDFDATDPPIDLGVTLWFHAAIAGHGANAAIAFAKPYGGRVVTLEGGAVRHVYGFAAGGKTGLSATLLANDASIDMLSTYNVDLGGVGQGFRYRVLQGDDVMVSEEPLLTEYNFDTDAPTALRVRGELFVAATDARSGAAISVARMDRQ